MNLSAEDHALIAVLNAAYPLGPPSRPVAADQDWAALAQQAERHDLSPLLFSAIKELDILAQIPPPVQKTLRTAALSTAHRNLLHFQELAAILDGLAQAAIPVIVLKGPHHALTLYASTAQRPMGDLDLLVPQPAVADFVKILEARGYTPHRMLGEGFEEAFSAELCYTRQYSAEITVNVEPHWHLFGSPHYLHKVPVAWVWESTQPFSVEGRLVLVLLPGAELLYLSAHLYLQHKGVGLRQSLDIARLLARSGAQIDWQEMAHTAQRFELFPALELALQDALTRWQVPLPPGAAAILQTRAAPGSDWQMATVQNRYSSHLFNVLRVGGAANRLAYVRKLLFPSHDYLKGRYGMKNPRLAPLFYAYRFALGLLGLPGMLAAFLRRR